MATVRERLSQWFIGTVRDDALIADAPPVPIRDIFRYFWPYARPYRPIIGLAMFFVVLGSALDTATIWMFKLLVDDVLTPRHFGSFWWIAGAYLGLMLLNGMVSFADDYFLTVVGERFLLNLRTRIFRHLHGLSLNFFEQRRLGDILTRLTDDIGSIESLVLSGVVDALAFAMRIVFFAAALLYLRWDLALLAFLAAPIFWFTARLFSRFIKQASRERRRRSGSLTAVAEESLSNVALVQAYNRQDTEVYRFHRQGVGKYAATLASTRLKALFSSLTGIIEVIGVLVVVAVGTWELAHEQMSLGGLLVFMTYLSQLYGPVRGLSRMANSVYSASASAERLIELLNEEPAVRDAPDAIALPRAHGQIAIETLTFRYPDEPEDALRDISVTVAPGQVLALVGPSGAGKSTLVKLLLRFYDPTAGRVLLDRRDMRQIAIHDLREQIAVLLQETLIFGGTVRENIAYGRTGASEEEIVAAARAADAHDFITALPGGYDTGIGEKGMRLSGGQRQRIAIARAMIRDAPVLILDEPTTGLDAEAAERVLAPLRRLMHGRTTIIITHDLATVHEADAILVLDDGRVAEYGTHAELLGHGGTYANLYRLHHPAVRSDAPGPAWWSQAPRGIPRTDHPPSVPVMHDAAGDG